MIYSHQFHKNYNLEENQIPGMVRKFNLNVIIVK